MKNRLHSYHSSKLVMNYERQVITTRQKFDVQITPHGNNFSRINSLNYRVGTIWNKLPYETKMLALKTMPTFTKHLKKLHLASYPDVCNQTDCYTCR